MSFTQAASSGSLTNHRIWGEPMESGQRSLKERREKENDEIIERKLSKGTYFLHLRFVIIIL